MRVKGGQVKAITDSGQQNEDHWSGDNEQTKDTQKYGRREREQYGKNQKDES